MEPFLFKEKEYFSIENWSGHDSALIAGFTTKHGGVSLAPFSSLNLGFHVQDKEAAVRENRRKLADILDFSINNWVGAEQTHEVHIETITRAGCGRGSLDYGSSFKATDGFFTQERGILLTLLFADCVPIYFYAPKKGAIGIAHGGWKGTVGGIAGEMVKHFQENNIPPSEIFVVIGPSICETCYIVDERVITLVQNILEDVGKKPYNRIKDNQYHLDLRKLNKQILMHCGILDEHIQVTNYCTSCHVDHFFSHRRDKGQTGRMMGFIGFKEAY